MVIPALLALLVLALFARMLPKILFRILVALILVPLLIGAYVIARELNTARHRLSQPPAPAVQQTPPITRPQATQPHRRQR